MSWIRNAEGNTLINLDHVEQVTITLAQAAGEAEEQVVGVFAQTGETEAGEMDGHWLFRGTEEECIRFLDGVASKLPMVRR